MKVSDGAHITVQYLDRPLMTATVHLIAIEVNVFFIHALMRQTSPVWMSEPALLLEASDAVRADAALLFKVFSVYS